MNAPPYELANELLGTADANGFDRPTWENFATKAMMVITEIDEARDGMTKGDIANAREELADIFIRTICILQSVFPDVWSVRRARFVAMFQTPEQHLWPMISHASRAVEAWRHDNRIDAQINMEYVLAYSAAVYELIGSNIFRAVERKNNANKQRGHLHGKARSEG